VPKPTLVVLEVGRRRTFASAVDWPGWCRSGKGEEAALSALAEYADRYRPVVAATGQRFPAGPAAFEVVERVAGNATTDFGAPAVVSGLDSHPLTAVMARGLASMVDAAWRELDRVAASAPRELRKGPRGGGRDRDAVVEHVVAADHVYARKLGLRVRAPNATDRDAVESFRRAVVDILSAPSDGSPVVVKGWPPRYAARRIAWHALDHAWEIEDKSVSEG
jgi:hypothetical protein